MKNFVSCHVHVRSLDSASTPEQFAKRETELDTGHIVVTDHGTLEATRHVYDLTKQKKAFQGLKPILGVEGYFRDDNCPILQEMGAPKNPEGVYKDTYEKHFKYGHLTLHALDEKGYSALSRVLSVADLRAESHGSERKPLFDWSNLEDLGSHNITGTSGCLIGIVGRHLIKNNDPYTAMKYYDRLRGCFKPGNFYVEIFPHNCDRNWESKVVVTFQKGDVASEMGLPAWKKVQTVGKAENFAISDLAAEFKRNGPKALAKHVAIVAIMTDRVMTPLEAPLQLINVEHREGFIQNECRPWCPDGDLQAGVNQFMFRMAAKYGDPVLVSDDSHFAYPEEKVVQDIRLGQKGDWRFANSHHRMDTAEALAYFKGHGFSDLQVEGWVEATRDWATRFDDFSFTPRRAIPTSFYPADTLRHTMALVTFHGRMNWNSPEMVARLTAEIELLHKNGVVDLLPYFMIDEEVCRLYARNGQLTGPGRGSAAGLLLAYLLGITHVDPLRFKLSMDRFMTKSRIQTGKLPDIDQDLGSRDLLVGANDQGGWLQERFGECVAQISVDTTLKLKSAIKDVLRVKRGFVPPEVEALTKKIPVPPQGIPDRDYVFGYKDSDGAWQKGLIEESPVLQHFVATYPDEWKIVKMLLGMPRQKSRHACAYVIADEPISNFIPLQTVGDVRCTSFTAAAVEASGGLKMDFLVVNSIKDIDHALKLVRGRHPVPAERLKADTEGVPYVEIDGRKVPELRVVPSGDQLFDVWDLPEDNDVFRDICTGKVETVFQLDAGAARQGLKYFQPDGKKLPLDSIEDLAAFTALDRPGPLDAHPAEGVDHNMLVEFANRARGGPRAGVMPVLDELLPESFGVIVYQEQLQYIFQKIGGTTAVEADEFRQRISKKKMVDVNKIDKPLFMKGAVERLGAEAAEQLWSMMQTFGQYGFNKSHAVCYVVVGYACAWLKRHYPLEWWTAVLSNAVERDRKEIDEKFWRYCGHLIDLPDVQMSLPTFTIQNERIRAPLNLLHGLGEKAHQQLVAAAPYATIDEFVVKIEDWRIAHPRRDPKTGEVVTNKDGRVRKGTSALNDGVVANLIISGAMDSLFPDQNEYGEPMTIEGRLALYAAAKAKATGARRIKSMAIGFDLKSALIRYQLRKKILPAYSAAMLPLVKEIRPDLINGKSIVTSYGGGQDFWRVVTGHEFETLSSLDLLSENDMKIAVLAYVVAERKFTYKKEDGERTAVELTLDVDGIRLPMVRWPSKHGLPEAFNNPLQGAVVACLLSRGIGSQSFFFAEPLVLAAPLNKKSEEEVEESPNAERSPEGVEGNQSGS